MNRTSTSSDEVYGLSSYRIYVSMKCHYKNLKFDYNKTRTKTSRTSYLERSDIRFFEELSKYQDSLLEELFISNFVFNPDLWIGDFVIEWSKCIDRVYSRRKYSNNFLKSFKSEIATYDGSIIRGMRTSKESWMPGLLNSLMSGRVSPDTLIMIDASVNGTWFNSLIESGKESYNDILVKSCQRLKKHSLFYKVDPELAAQLRQAILDHS